MALPVKKPVATKATVPANHPLAVAHPAPVAIKPAPKPVAKIVTLPVKPAAPPTVSASHPLAAAHPATTMPLTPKPAAKAAVPVVAKPVAKPATPVAKPVAMVTLRDPKAASTATTSAAPSRSNVTAQRGRPPSLTMLLLIGLGAYFVFRK